MYNNSLFKIFNLKQFSDCNKNEKTEISIEKNGNDEDGQHIFIENET